MVKRGVALVVSLTVTSVAFGQAVVELVPNPPGPAYSGGDTVMVDVFLSQAAGSADHSLRMVQFDTSASTLPAIFGPVGVDGKLFWEFDSTPMCNPPGDTLNCGADYYIDGLRSGLPPGPDIFAIAFGSAGELGENPSKQLVLPGDGTRLKVGVFQITLPRVNDRLVLDVLNVNNDNLLNPDFGSQVRWGFGMNINGEPLTNWRGDNLDLTGNPLEFCIGTGPPGAPCVVPSCGNGSIDLGEECDGGVDCDSSCLCVPPAVPTVPPSLDCASPPGIHLVSSTPLCDVSLTRPANSVIRLTFDNPIPDPVTATDLEIREITDGSQGVDISGQFTFTVEGGNVLRITEAGTAAFTSGLWYAIINNNTWTGVSNFEVDYPVVHGDANNSWFTNFADLAAISANQIDPTTDDDRFDINGSGFVNFADLAAAFSFNDDAAQDPKPTGHGCFAD